MASLTYEGRGLAPLMQLKPRSPERMTPTKPIPAAILYPGFELGVRGQPGGTGTSRLDPKACAELRCCD